MTPIDPSKSVIKQFWVKAPGFAWYCVHENYYRHLLKTVEAHPAGFDWFKFAEVVQFLN